LGPLSQSSTSSRKATEPSAVRCHAEGSGSEPGIELNVNQHLIMVIDACMYNELICRYAVPFNAQTVRNDATAQCLPVPVLFRFDYPFQHIHTLSPIHRTTTCVPINGTIPAVCC
jgi:hypothetical protein